MANVRPTAFITGYTFMPAGTTTTVQGVFIPLTGLPGLTATEADHVVGDARKFVYELIRTTYINYTNLSTAAKPGKMSVSRGTATGIDSVTVRQPFTFLFDLDISGSDVSAE